MKKHAILLFILCLQLLAYGRSIGESSLQGQGLHFIENKGQIRDQQGNPRTDIDFVLQSRAVTVYIGDGALHYQFIKPLQDDSTTYSRENPPKHYQVSPGFVTSRLDVELQDANKDASIITEAPEQAEMHYYNVEDVEGITGAKTYGKIIYKNIYPSIDWVLYTEGKTFKYDFIVHPGGNVQDILLKYGGAESIKLESDGSLRVSSAIGTITESAPYLYELDSKREISGAYVLNGSQLQYQTEAYTGTLIIDPGVEWSTYLGGEGAESAGHGLAYDSEGYIYISGTTTSHSNLATTGAHQDTFGGGNRDAFLAKFDTTGQIQWTTYYGGSGHLDNGTFFAGAELEVAVSCDPFGHVYVAGRTFSSTGIATPGSYQDTGSSVASERNYDGGYNGYLVQFNRDGIRQWGTYYGASTSATVFTSVACDSHGNVYAAGFADSSISTTGALVTSGAHQTVFSAPPASSPWPGVIPVFPQYNGLLVKFDSSGNREWATYYGDAGIESVNSTSSRILDVASDLSGNVYVTGSGIGGNTTQGTHQAQLTGDVGGFLAKFDSNGMQLWGSYLNGGGKSIFIDAFQHLYVSGNVDDNLTDSLIITAGCHQPNIISGPGGSNQNGFLMQMNPANGTRNWGTYYGAEGDTYIDDVTCDFQGNVYITGNTNSYGDLYTIAAPGALKDTLTPGSDTGAFANYVDVFVAKFDSSGTRKWATYYGGTESDAGIALICDAGDALYLSGNTESASSIAIEGSHQDTIYGPSDAFLVRLLPVDIALTDIMRPDRDTACAGEIPFLVAIKNQGRLDKDDTLWISYTFNGPSTGGLDTFFTGGLDAGLEADFGLGNLNMPFPGNYELTVYLHVSRGDQERNNDTIHLTLTATNAEPVAEIVMSQVGTTYHFSNPSGQFSDTYHWDFGDGTTSDEANPSHSYSETDSYLVTLIVTGFCGSDTATMLIEGVGDGSGIRDPALAAKLSVYPNPASEVLFIKAETGLRAEAYRIVNVLGQEMKKGVLKPAAQLDIRSLSAGSYLLHIRTDKGMMSKAFQVLRK